MTKTPADNTAAPDLMAALRRSLDEAAERRAATAGRIEEVLHRLDREVERITGEDIEPTNHEETR